MSTRYTHRVIRGFPVGDVTYQRGELVSSDDWTYQGKIYVEARGWVESLPPRSQAHYADLFKRGVAVDRFGEIIEVEPTTEEIVAEVKEVRKVVAAKKAPAKKKSPAKKAAPVKKAVKKSVTKTGEK
jgi:hypothetical protein